MLQVSDRLRRLLLNNQVAPAELLLIRRRSETRAGGYYRRTNAPSSITHDGVEYLSGEYPLAKMAQPDSVRSSERAALQLQVIDPRFVLRDELLARGVGHLLVEVKLALLTEQMAVEGVLDVYRGHCISGSSEVDASEGPVVNLAFSGPLDKLSSERVMTVSKDSQSQRDPKDNSLDDAHTSRTLIWVQ